MTIDELITAMLDVATDAEANALDDLLVRCGYWWQCSVCKTYNVRSAQSCEECEDGRRPEGQFPPGMPGTGERVDADPANFLRDLFLENRGRIPATQAENAVGRMTFTYGGAITEAWRRLQDESYVERDGSDWIWPMQMESAR